MEIFRMILHMTGRHWESYWTEGSSKIIMENTDSKTHGRQGKK